MINYFALLYILPYYFVL